MKANAAVEQRSRALSRHISKKISEQGAISFAEYMRAALYAPNLGYYSASSNSNANDYFTSPMVHPAFGAALAIFSTALFNCTSPDQHTVIEIGAGDGLLAADFTQYLRECFPALSQSLNYLVYDIAVQEPSHYPVLPASQLGNQQAWLVVANELIDAFPVHLFEVRDGRPMEVLIKEENGRFVEHLALASPAIHQRLAPYIESLPEHYRGEVCLDVVGWVEQISRIVPRGFVVIIDYGMTQDRLYAPDRAHGTIQNYATHLRSSNILENPGTQDITAHVDFTALTSILQKHGFNLLLQTSQQEFLTSMGLRKWCSQITEMRLSEYHRIRNTAGMRKLLDPVGLGSFTVAIYARGSIELPDSLDMRNQIPPVLEKYAPRLDLMQPQFPY